MKTVTTLPLVSFLLLFVPVAMAQQNLPFKKTPSASRAGITLKESDHNWRETPNRLAADAPNIVIFMTDDTGFGNPSTFGGPIKTPTLSKLAKEGIMYNGFHTTAMCSPTRASLLTGRNHHHVGYGQISELAADWDGYVGEIPRETATLPQVLKSYGYTCGAFGKWHNTPTTDITPTGPFDQWPTGLGFDYFYGFLAGEASQYEPMLFENTLAVDYPKKENYHLTEDLADHAISFMRHHQMNKPGKPFFVYFTPGAVHGPHHVAKEWSEKYRGRFDEGWEALRVEVYERQKELGVIPPDAELTDIDPTMTKWKDIPKSEREFQTRLMEIYAGFLEHTDFQYGRVLEELENLGVRDNTIVIYINGDNGSSSEGFDGSISELLAQNGMPSTTQQQIAVLNETYGGLDALGTDKLDNMYHHGWAWAGSTPFKGTKLVAAQFGGTRNPMVISWPSKIKPDTEIRSQFMHVIDIAPTVYDVLEITPPDFYNGVAQDEIDGNSFKETFFNASAESTNKLQYFEIFGSRGIYKDGWFACTFGPRNPWNPAASSTDNWDPYKDKWELYNLKVDFTQQNNLAQKNPMKLRELQDVFLVEAQKNKVFPIGGALYILPYHPEQMKASTNTEWNMYEGMTRIPESQAPKFMSGFSTHSVINVDVSNNDSGVLYAVGGVSAGFTVYMDQGEVFVEYNAMTLNRFKLRSQEKLSAGNNVIEVKVLAKEKKPLAPSKIQLFINGKQVGEVVAEVTVPALFSASETFDIGMDKGSGVSLEYHERLPFAFSGTINKVTIKYL